MADTQRSVAIIGASADRAKYGNKSVRAHLKEGWKVFPVNPKETEIEGLQVYPSVLDIPEKVDRISVYLPPSLGMKLLEDFKTVGAPELFFNPGAESSEILEKARAMGLPAVAACSIIALGQNASDY
jgi:predicted CoA-binding protein